ncbi:MAG: hypothetical protein ACRD4R_07295 [Candidatus Acidiferrales bacterium]
MIRRYPPRPTRRPYQDFHSFAASDPIANLESQFARPPQPVQAPPEPPSVPEPSQPIITAETPVQIYDPPAAPTRTIVKLFGPAERAAEAALEAAQLRETNRTAPAARARKPRSKPRKRNRSSARLATPRANRAKPVRRALPVTDTRSDHELRCTICSDPDRADIENEFMHWHAVGNIAHDYNVSRSAIYRHAHALGLFSRRNRNLRFALGHLIERVEDVEPTADSIVRAIHAFARISDEGEWVEPPAHVIVSSGGIRREAAAPPGRRPIAIPLDSQTISSVIDVTPDPTLPAVAPGVPSALLRDGVAPGTGNRVSADATP